MLQIKNFCGTNLKLEGKNLAWRILLVLIYYRTGKAKSETSHRMGNKFPTDLWCQVLQAEVLSQQTSPCEGFFPSTDGEKTLTSQLEYGHAGYNKNC